MNRIRSAGRLSRAGVRRAAGLMAVALVLVTNAACSGDSYLVRDIDKWNANFKPIDENHLVIGERTGVVLERLAVPFDEIDSFEHQGKPVRMLKIVSYDGRISQDVVRQRYFLFFMDGRLAHWNTNGNMADFYNAVGG